MTIIDYSARVDATDVRLRSHGLRIASLERLFASTTRQAAQPGPPGPKGDAGPQGAAGPQGDVGPPPAHRWEGTSLQFEQPNGEWGPLVDLQGPRGKRGQDGYGGGGVASSYFPSGW